MVGAEMALIGCLQSDLRCVIQEVVDQSKDLPHSTIGGPRALDGPINKGSYLFNFGDLSEDKVDEWISLANQLGINQIDFHGGTSFRFGDCYPNPETYPEGRQSLKRVIDRLHDAGISAGLHTYAFFIDKKTGQDYCDQAATPYCAWVKAAGREWTVSGASYDGKQIKLEFGESGVSAIVEVTVRERYLLFKVIGVKGDDVESFGFIGLSLKAPGDPF
ncbi:MAG: hypothetical protein GY869_32465, partial [Planctomycetes bacterium]|nr:hypothetical protein [Planctomycetota bacterium]